MMSIDDIISSLGTSKPIFNLKINKRSAELELIDEYKPIKTSDDPVEAVVLDYYREWFCSSSKEMVKSPSIKREVLDKINSFIIRAYVENCGLKKPNLSKTYKFLCKRLILEPELCSLYRYIAPHVDVHNDYSIENTNAELNFLMMLERMKEKYDR